MLINFFSFRTKNVNSMFQEVKHFIFPKNIIITDVMLISALKKYNFEEGKATKIPLNLSKETVFNIYYLKIRLF